ncbi:hypothetical protein D3C73_1309240 [compost metagenome]
MAFHGVLDDAMAGVIPTDIQLKGCPADLVGNSCQVVSSRGDVHGHDLGPVSVQGPGDGGSDSPCCAGDHCHLAGEGFVGVVWQAARR